MRDRPAAGYWERIQTLFAEAVARPVDERAAFLERACAGEPAVRAEIESLLNAHERAGSFLAQPMLEELVDPLPRLPDDGEGGRRAES